MLNNQTTKLVNKGFISCENGFILNNQATKLFNDGLIKLPGWRSGEITRLPPMWPGFDFKSSFHMSGKSQTIRDFAVFRPSQTNENHKS